MTRDKELKVRISGDASALGAESRKAVNALNEVKSAASGLLAAFTGGVIGGGIAGAITGVVNLVGEQIRSARQLVSEARIIDMTPQFLKGAKKLGDLLFSNASVIPTAIENATRVRSDAAAGGESANATLARLGIEFKAIAGLGKEELFETLIRAFREGPDTQVRRAALADVFGMGQANALLPFIVGKEGSQMDFNRHIRWRGEDPYTPGFGLDALRRDLDQQYRGRVEPISMAGVGNEETAARLRGQNDSRELELKRSTLEVEQQILQITEQRAKLEERMVAETDSVKRERLRAEIISLDAEMMRLQRDPGRDRSARRQSSLFASPVSADEFAQRGMFIGGQQRVPAILDKQLVELQTLVREMRETRNLQRETWA